MRNININELWTNAKAAAIKAIKAAGVTSLGILAALNLTNLYIGLKGVYVGADFMAVAAAKGIPAFASLNSLVYTLAINPIVIAGLAFIVGFVVITAYYMLVS